MRPSPRKTRSCSRLVSASYDPDSSAPDSPLLASPAHHLAITPVPVMKAESMEPARGHQPGSEKRARHKMTEPQLQRLEALYRANTHPDRQAKGDVAKETGMPLKTVLIWFQNRRQDRRRSKAAAASKAAAQRADRAQAPKARKPSAAKPKTSESPLRKKPRITVTTTPTATATSMTPAQNTARQLSPQATAPTVSSHADDLMDVDESSPSTAPTSVHEGNKQMPRIARSPSSSLDSSSSAGNGPNALWRFINVSPPPPPPLPVPAPTATHGAGPARRPFGNLQGRQGLTAHRPDLEWACANSAFRRKHGQYVYRDEDDSEGESSEHEDLPAHGAENATHPQQDGPSLILRRRWQQREAAGAEPHRDLPSDLRVAIPRDYDLLFPPDMVLGASLLLTLKHSAGSARAMI
ncbi:hypothetical protein TRAPUB_6749 [Trametes pubescens]|uniref:Homeobox domain-containing protein n=1 Tax=Trametes pubescens TaxID=154538 RepID=A0A1M2V567_TRAPU|nr:hypothetical protein TRAPUB_6749 [Trametes pubescens]